MLNSESAHRTTSTENNHIVRVFANNEVHQVDIIEIQGKLVVNNNYIFHEENKENIFNDSTFITTNNNTESSPFLNKHINNTTVDNGQKQYRVSIQNNSSFLPLGKVTLMENGNIGTKKDNKKIQPEKCTLEIGTSIRVSGLVQPQSQNGKVLLLIKKIQSKQCISSEKKRASNQVELKNDTIVNNNRGKVELFSDWLTNNKEALTLNACFCQRDSEQECRHHKRDRTDQTSIYAEVNSCADNVEFTDYEIVGLVHRRFHFSGKPTRVFT